VPRCVYGRTRILTAGKKPRRAAVSGRGQNAADVVPRPSAQSEAFARRMGRFSDAPSGRVRPSAPAPVPAPTRRRTAALIQQNDVVEQSKFKGSLKIRITEDVTLENLNETIRTHSPRRWATARAL
jgi:hypothetical protein